MGMPLLRWWLSHAWTSLVSFGGRHSVAQIVARNKEDPYLVAVMKDSLLFSWPCSIHYLRKFCAFIFANLHLITKFVKFTSRENFYYYTYICMYIYLNNISHFDLLYLLLLIFYILISFLDCLSILGGHLSASPLTDWPVFHCAHY